MYKYTIVLSLTMVLWTCSLPSFAREGQTQQTVNQQIRLATQGFKSDVGVAYLLDNHLYTYNDTIHYPLMSVFKLHVAVAALQRMETEGTLLHDTRQIDSIQMRRNTYSPLLDRYPSGGFRISYADLLYYALALSDNNACDILIDYAGGIEAVKACTDRVGLTGYDLTETEASMHEDTSACYHNWAHPSSVAHLLKKIHDGSLLNAEHTRFICSTLIETSTGSNKIRAGLPAGITIGHKTGSSGRINGLTIADNDAACIYLPDGRRCYLVIFVKDSHESDSKNAALIARITHIIYNTITQTH
ncbi:MAG TPA: class A beta-lactamase [Candidatus Barnesiella excrementavium]|nr:class A beta-lactamase [Candidatus Barnesiella excrementavium]